MSWFADLAGKAESLLNNLDEQTGAVLRNHNGNLKEKKHDYILHPEGTWGQKKKTVSRTTKKNGSNFDTRSNYASIKSTPVRSSRSPTSQNNCNIKNGLENVRKKSPVKKDQYTLNNCPKTLVDDFNDLESVDQYGLRHRRNSLPSDLELVNTEKLAYNMQNLEVENAMLKNELNVMNREVSELLDRLRKTEDELKASQIKLESSEKLNLVLTENKNSLVLQLQSKGQITENNNHEINKYKEQNQELESHVGLLNNKNKELEEKIIQLTEELNTKNTAQIKLENDLRHAQTTISEQQSNLEKTTTECLRLEKDWEAYKLRVKSMLNAKDNQIQSLRTGTNLSEETKMLMEQVEILKEEKEDLSQGITRVRNEFDDIRQRMSQLEQQNAASERVVAALRETLREERLARNRAEGQCVVLRKELQNIQIETNQTIINLRTSLQVREEELNNLRDTASSVQTDNALNVADYDVIKDIDSEKIHYLTQMLIQKQGKIDSLLADNNIMRIQLDKLESKHRSELASLQSKYTHSVVHLQDDSRMRTRNIYSSSPFSALSLRIGVMIKRFPIFRLLIMIYMIGLHLWVVTVLFTSTPEEYVPRQTKIIKNT